MGQDCKKVWNEKKRMYGQKKILLAYKNGRTRWFINGNSENFDQNCPSINSYVDELKKGI